MGAGPSRTVCWRLRSRRTTLVPMADATVAAKSELGLSLAKGRHHTRAQALRKAG